MHENAKENWIGEQCSETEEKLRKINSRRADDLVKDVTTVKPGKATTVQDRSGKCYGRIKGKESIITELEAFFILKKKISSTRSANLY